MSDKVQLIYFLTAVMTTNEKVLLLLMIGSQFICFQTL
jgi:hypothetical protein